MNYNLCTWNGLKGLFEELEIRGIIEIIQTTVLLRSVRIHREGREIWGDLFSLRLQGKKTMCEKLTMINWTQENSKCRPYGVRDETVITKCEFSIITQHNSFTTLKNGVCINQNLSLKMWRIKFPGTLRYKGSHKSYPEDQTLF